MATWAAVGAMADVKAVAAVVTAKDGQCGRSGACNLLS